METLFGMRGNMGKNDEDTCLRVGEVPEVKVS